MKIFLLWLTSVLFSTLLLGQNKYTSPNKNIELVVQSQQKQIVYSIVYLRDTIIYPSELGFKAKKTYGATTQETIDFVDSMVIVREKEKKINDQWRPILGEVKTIQNECNEITFELQSEKKGKPYLMNIIFRIFNDGVGFRYEFPKQTNLNRFVIEDEITNFELKEDYTAWWQAGNFNTNEYPLHETKLSAIDALNDCESNKLFTAECLPWLIQTPLMLKSPKGIYVNIHEAALVHFPAMQLRRSPNSRTLSSDLVPDAMHNKAYLETPFATPWRTILISNKATDILASKTILNLNEPNKLKDVSFIKPVKYIGVWWEMFVGKGTWDYLGTQNSAQETKPTGKHSANTANVKKYIDFASKHGFDGILVEGWNVGWEDWFAKWKENVFDFVTPYPDFNVKELQAYAKSKNVYLIMHHETSGSVLNYERHIDSAYQFMNENGYPAVKTGYVGPIIPRGENHDGQWMVDHYIRVAEKTAAKKIMLDVHEPVRPTGLHRTYPNWLACEAARGMEYNAWGDGNAIDHDLNLIFTRFIGGPMDYTPGIFKLKLDYFPNKKEIIHSTLARQLALYVVMYSPLQMAADLPENYEAKLDAFQFIKDVSTDWDDTKILEAEPGEYVTTARKGKNTNNWFIGSITDEKKRSTKITLDFLDANKNYEATIYADDKNTLVDVRPELYSITKKTVQKGDVLNLDLAGAGGVAVSIIEVKGNKM